MAAPTQPTPTTIVTEALNKYGIKSPTAAQITRATDYGLELTKDAIWLFGKKWKSLLTTVYMKVVANQVILNLPTDIEEIKDATLLDGLNRGQVGAVPTTTSIPLQSMDSNPTSGSLGSQAVLSYETSDATLVSGQSSTITAYNSATNTLTVSPAFSLAPTQGDAVLVQDRHYPLEIKWVSEYDKLFYPTIKSYPTHAYHQPDATVGKLLLSHIPDKSYFIRLRYYASLQMLDLAGTRYQTVLRRWKPVLVQGVFAWLLEDNSDDRHLSQLNKLTGMLKILVGREIDGVNLSDMQREVED